MTLLASFSLDSYMCTPLYAGIFIGSYSKQNVSDVTFESTIIYWSINSYGKSSRWTTMTNMLKDQFSRLKHQPRRRRLELSGIVRSNDSFLIRPIYSDFNNLFSIFTKILRHCSKCQTKFLIFQF